MKRARISVSTVAIAALIGVGFVAAPVGFDDQMTLEVKSASAKGAGKSSGKGGGKKGGSKSSKSGKSSGSDLDTADSHDGDEDKVGNGHIKAKGNGHAKNHDGEGDHDPSAHGKLSSSLGNLNAAHASDTARENASENSIVGMLALYAAEAENLTPEEAQEELGAISNKSEYDEDLETDLVSAEVVDEVNRLLGVENNVVEDDDAPVENP